MRFPDFFTTRQSFEIFSTYFRVPLDIKQQNLKSKYFVDVIENSFLFDFHSFHLLLDQFLNSSYNQKMKTLCFIYVYYPL